MSKSLTLEADPYFDLSATDRNHLLAVALLNANTDALPSQRTVREAVGDLANDPPTEITTSRSLRRLAECGYVERVKGEPEHNTTGAIVTDKGKRVLERGAARLDAAATVGCGDE